METEHLNIGEWKYLEAEKDRGNRAEFDSSSLGLCFLQKQFSNYCAFQESHIFPKECK